MKRFEEKDWDEIRRFCTGMRAAKVGGVQIVVDARRVVELFDELEALRADVKRLSKPKRKVAEAVMTVVEQP